MVSGPHVKAAQAENKTTLSQRIRRLIEWCQKNNLPSDISNPIKELHQNIAVCKVAYDQFGSLRTRNMVDRLMQRMDPHLFSTQYFRESITSAELSLRGWTLIQNFAPYNLGQFS
jgi:hypothetical protein